MTDFFDELEPELRRPHRRDIARSSRARLFDLRRLPGLPAVGRGALVALAVLVALVAVVLAIAREADVERPVAPPPQPSPTTAGPGGCAPWQAPIVDEPIPQEIATRFAIFRDPPPRWQAAARLPEIPQARKLYRGPVTLRPLLDTGGPTGSRPGHRERFRVVVIAAAISTGQPDPDICAPPPDPIEPGICVASFRPTGKPDGAMCYSIDQIEGAHAWFGGRTVFGHAPDGAERVIFDTPSGPQSVNVSGKRLHGRDWLLAPGLLHALPGQHEHPFRALSAHVSPAARPPRASVRHERRRTRTVRPHGHDCGGHASALTPGDTGDTPWVGRLA